MKRKRLILCGISVLVAMASITGIRKGVHYWLTKPDNILITLNGDRAMEPYIGSKVYFVADRNAYLINPPCRWDAVVFDERPESVATARWIVGLPGESISVSDGELFINRLPAVIPPEKHAKFGTEWKLANAELPDLSMGIPDDSYLLLSGNPASESESRQIEIVERARIFGRVTR